MGFFNKLWKGVKKVFSKPKPIKKNHYGRRTPPPPLPKKAPIISRATQKKLANRFVKKTLPRQIKSFAKYGYGAINGSPINKVMSFYKLTKPTQDIASDIHMEAMKKRGYRSSVGRAVEGGKSFISASPLSYIPLIDPTEKERFRTFTRVDPRLKNDTATKIIRGVGTVGGFMVGGEASAPKVGAKLLGTKAGTKAIGSLASKNFVRNLAKKDILKVGGTLAKGNIDRVARNKATGILNRTVDGIARNLTTDMARSSNISMLEGNELGSKKHLQALKDNALYGTVAEVGLGAVPLVRGLKGVNRKIPDSLEVAGKKVVKGGNDLLSNGFKAPPKVLKPDNMASKLEKTILAKPPELTAPKLTEAQDDIIKNVKIKNIVNKPKPVTIKNTSEISNVKKIKPTSEKPIIKDEAIKNELSTSKKDLTKELNSQKKEFMDENGLIQDKGFTKKKPLMAKGENPTKDPNLASKTEKGQGFTKEQIPKTEKIKGETKATASGDFQNGEYKKYLDSNINDAKKYGKQDILPKATSYGEVSKTADTLAKSYFNEKDALSEINKLTAEGTLSKTYQSNKVSMADAERRVKDLGIDNAFRTWKSAVDGTRGISPTMTAEAKLYFDHAAKTGNRQMMDEVAVRLVDSMSETGRDLQAMRLFINNSPTGRIAMTQRAVFKIEQQTGAQIHIEDSDIKKLGSIEDPAEAFKFMGDLKVKIWNQVPATWTEKLTAWRYLAMLGNPKTHIRNILGNTLFMPVKEMRDIIKVGLERALVKDGERTASFLTSADKPLRDLGKKFIDLDMGSIADDTSKFFYGSRRPIGSKVFDNKIIEKFNQFNSNLLEKEDRLFMNNAYTKYFAKYLKANGANSKNLTGINDDLLKKARQYATSEALDSTYREFSSLAHLVNKLKEWHNTPLKELGETRGEQILKKGVGVVSEAMLPFAKTPTNILKRGISYSPIGLMKGMAKIITAKGDNARMLKAISDLAEGITGTGLFIIGSYLANKGLVTGSMGNDKLSKFKKDLGAQEYSIKIGDWSYTLDWVAPMAMPFFAGVEASKAFTEDKGVDADNLFGALSKITEPMFNMSMLQGVENAFKIDQYSDVSAVTQIGTNALTGYANQFFPTLGGQISRTIDNTRRTATPTLTKNPTLRSIEWQGRKILNKIPLASKLNSPYVDVWGNEQDKPTAGHWVDSAVENFVSPGFLRYDNRDETDKKLIKLAERTGETDYIPSKARTRLKFKGEDYTVNGKDYADMQKKVGTESYNRASNIQSDNPMEYRKAYRESSKNAERDYFVTKRNIKPYDYDFEYLGKAKKEKYALIKDRVSKKDFVKGTNAIKGISGAVADQRKAVTLLRQGIDDPEIIKAIAGVRDGTIKKARKVAKTKYSTDEIKSFAENARNTKGRVTKKSVMQWLSRTNYSNAEKKIIFAILLRQNMKNPY